MDSNGGQGGAEYTYFYDDKNKVTSIENESYLQFDKEDLKEVSLDDYYKELETLYADAKKESGVTITLRKDEKNNKITMKSIVDVKTYNMDSDVLSLASEGNLDDIKDVIELKEALGYYTCGSIK